MNELIITEKQVMELVRNYIEKRYNITNCEIRGEDYVTIPNIVVTFDDNELIPKKKVK